VVEGEIGLPATPTRGSGMPLKAARRRVISAHTSFAGSQRECGPVVRDASAGPHSLHSVYGGGIDRPLEVIRIGYTPQPSNNGPYHLDTWAARTP
jgi:hypothetical protein